jgi:hypothetical protein
MHRNVLVIVTAIGLCGLLGMAQSRDTYKARLSALPADAKSHPEMTGSGTVTAMLEGAKLTIDGSFEGLKTKATTASLHDSVATGVRGPSIHDLTVATDLGGRITGSLNLTADQVEHLKKGRLYVQIHSEKAAEGVLWGWFLR